MNGGLALPRGLLRWSGWNGGRVTKCCELEVRLRWTEGAGNVGTIVEEVFLGLKKPDLV